LGFILINVLVDAFMADEKGLAQQKASTDLLGERSSEGRHAHDSPLAGTELKRIAAFDLAECGQLVSQRFVPQRAKLRWARG
jgi:hypothetical protein